MESLNTSQIDKPQARKCIVNTCKTLVEPMKAGRYWFTARYCKPCGEKIMLERIAEEEQARRIAAIQRLALPPRFIRAGFDSFKTEYQPTAFTVARRYADEFKAGKTQKGLYLYGLAGSGKTHLAAAIGTKLMLDVSARFITVPELLIDIRKTFGKNDQDNTILDRLASAGLLILDDLGSEKPTEWVQETLFVLIDRRYTAYRPTIITSNDSLDQLKNKLGYRIASRIAEMTEVVELRANDYRLKKQ